MTGANSIRTTAVGTGPWPNGGFYPAWARVALEQMSGDRGKSSSCKVPMAESGLSSAKAERLESPAQPPFRP